MSTLTQTAPVVNPVRRPKVYPPARCDVLLLRPLVYPCEMLPQGIPALLSLNDEDYHLTAYATWAGVNLVVDGYRFQKVAEPASEPRDVSCTRYGLECDCPDRIFRKRIGGECKHMRCVRILRERGDLA